MNAKTNLPSKSELGILVEAIAHPKEHPEIFSWAMVTLAFVTVAALAKLFLT